MVGVDSLELWSDCGPHYRNATCIATYGVDLMIEYPDLQNVALVQGVEHHMKQQADTFFQRLNHRKSERQMLQDMKTGDDLRDAWRTAHLEEKALDPTLPDEIFTEFIPALRSSLRCSTAMVSKLPVGVTSCHVWRFHRVRPTRPVYWSSITQTGLNVRGLAAMLYDNKIHDASMWFDVIRERPVYGPHNKPDEGAPPETAMFWNGWKMSYRTEFPENATGATLRAKLGRKLNAYKGIVDRESQRQKPLAFRRQRALNTAEKKKVVSINVQRARTQLMKAAQEAGKKEQGVFTTRIAFANRAFNSR